MFNNDFYPTPQNIIQKMIAPYTTAIAGRHYMRNLQILEPSAGKGNIIDYLTSAYRIKPSNIACMEIEPELQLVLQGKGYKLIGDDFLEYNGRYHFDLILMNPPFSAGAAHLLKAWEVVAHGGKITCLLNAETLDNPHTRQRQLLARIVEGHGEVERLGQCFRTAERRTAVNVVLVRLTKPERETVVDFSDEKLARDYGVSDDEFGANPLAHSNIIESFVSQYDHASRLLVEQHEIEKKLRFYLSGVKIVDDGRKDAETINERLDELKKDFWKYIFDKTKIGRVTTSQFQEKLTQFTDSTISLAFTVANINKILSVFFLNKEQIMLECVEAVFDRATDFHAKNKVWVEGWKTNKAWKVNKRIIMPWGVDYDARYTYWSWRAVRRDFYSDLDKVLCWLDGRSLENVTTVAEAMDTKFKRIREAREDYKLQFESTYFRIRIFKKGTVHLDFKDKNLLDELNRQAARRKGWRIGGGY